jgi:hypothetical protein
MRNRTAAALCTALTLASTASAQTPLFTESRELPVVIEGRIDTLARGAARRIDPYPAVLSVEGGPRFDLKLSARGMFRRVSGVCSFPPLRLEFQPDQVQGTLFEGQGRLKLVTRCRRNYEHLVVLEYTVYRLFNALTPDSFRVRPLRVTYVDTGGGRAQTQFNFVIEPIDGVANRNHRAVVQLESGAFDSAQLDPRSTAIVSVFEYMIGNLDWDFLHIAQGRSCCHNVHHLGETPTSTAGIIPVPYDFDQSGFVDAPYATPSPGLRVRSVRSRVFRGYCRHNDQLPAVLALFREHRDELYAVVDGEKRLSEKHRVQARRYLEAFYAIADNPADWNREVVEHCMGQAGSSASMR